MTQTRSTLDAQIQLRRLILPALGLLFALGVAPACRRQENAASTPTPGPSPAAGQPAPNAAPVIRDAAEPRKQPWSGLAEPRGAALDDRGRLWVADFGHSRVAIFNPKGGYLGGWGGVKGNGQYQLQEPAALTIRGDDVYVADTWNGRVQHFTTLGQFRETAATGLYGPRGVAVTADGTVWIADSGNHRIALVKAGQAVRYIGKSGSGPDGLSSPVGITVGPSGQVYVADIGNDRIQVVAADGKFLRSIPVAAWKKMMEPNIAVDDQENLFITAPASSAVLEIDRSGKALRTWAADDGGRKFLRPTGLALDRANGVLYVTDTAAGAIGVIRLSGKAPTPTMRPSPPKK